MVQPDINQGTMRLFLAELATINYFNNDQKLVRIKLTEDNVTKYFDFYLIESVGYPNPDDHFALVATLEDIISGADYAITSGDDRVDLPPGYADSSTLVDQVPWGFVWLVNKRMSVGTTNPNDTSAGMHNTNADITSKKENIKYSLSPALKRDYTTTRSKELGDLNNESIGVFVTGNSVVLKSEAASIVLGPQGISILGDKFESHTKGRQGMMKDNPLNGWIPSTMMTGAMVIPYIPDPNFIIGVGTAAKIMNKGIAAIGGTATNVKNLITSV
jgi:hypothetical protein